MNTKIINKIIINEEDIAYCVKRQLSIMLNEEIDKKIKDIELLCKEIEKIIKNKWVYIKNKDVYYNHDLTGLFPNFYKFQLGFCSVYTPFDKTTLNLNFNGYNGRLLNEFEITIIKNSIPINEKYEKNYTFMEDENYKCIREDGYIFNFNNFHAFGFNSYHIPIYDLKTSKKLNKNNLSEIIRLWFQNDLIPEGLSKLSEITYRDLLSYYKMKFIGFDFNNEKIQFLTDNIKENILFNEKDFCINGKILNYDKAWEELEQKGNINIQEISQNDIFANLLNCETVRADIESYDKKILEDPNRGHWDLWDKEDEILSENITVNFEKGIVARNPIADIKEDGIIGIDFGTKSTVVVYQEDREHTLPMRVGMGKYSKKIESKHYENPTVMEFIDLEDFLESYNKKNGRPNTLWENLTVSHTAFNSLMASSSENYYSFLSDLKQWAGDSNRNLRLRDKCGKEKTLNSYIDLKEDSEFDPIEIYAYYIGLYINNMHNGIYLDYILSFPVTYEKNIREKILNSFSNGLKKSLPEPILNDDNVINRFRVSSGASEPAAYAICALEEYKFEPKDGEKIFYGVFDFGGGTTDFDFGLWRPAEGREQRRFDYVIEHFGAGGDQFLGGENLLELLAFEVFKDNQDKLRKEGITFTLPPECIRFPGSEILLNDSQEAKLNMKQLMEKLRSLWEKTIEYEEEFINGIISLNLFDKSGEQKLNFELSVDIKMLEEILYNRIEKGVINFFEALKLSFAFEETEGVENIKIFLAGNSSKSNIVTELFLKHIEKETNKINEYKKEQGEYFTIYPPLGTNEAYLIQEKLNIEINKEDITRPTGKTGVAFGLIKSRAGGKIKVIDKNLNDNEIMFKYYIGYEKRGKFNVHLDRSNKYGEWNKFIDACYEDFELYYTPLPEATSNELNIGETQRKKCRIDITSEDEDVNVYIRFLSPTEIEYVVAKDDFISEEKYLNTPKKEKLG
ncbi:UNVERIFIED_ORG: hypothetical protein B2H95_05660 [Clostridium botulinum]|uniref:hypothetical protein n=1 Tax=Clostridium sp. ZBS15 TaxID=2949969 RepID=UPI000A16D9A3|nr:hypothetical protein [Clostridium sp. ZBS15]